MNYFRSTRKEVYYQPADRTRLESHYGAVELAELRGTFNPAVLLTEWFGCWPHCRAAGHMAELPQLCLQETLQMFCESQQWDLSLKPGSKRGSKEY